MLSCWGDNRSAGCIGSKAPSPTCLNGVIDSGEDCDGGNLGGASCTSLGFLSGTLSCGANCLYDTSSCNSISASCDLNIAVNELHRFEAQAVDPEGDDLYYTFDWDDSTTSRQPASGYVASGVQRYHDKSYSLVGTYNVTALATDINGNSSPASAPLEVCVETPPGPGPSPRLSLIHI